MRLAKAKIHLWALFLFKKEKPQGSSQYSVLNGEAFSVFLKFSIFEKDFERFPRKKLSKVESEGSLGIFLLENEEGRVTNVSPNGVSPKEIK